MILTILVGLLTFAQSQCPSGCICDEHDKSAQCVQTDEDAKFVHIPDGLPWYVQEVILTDNLIKVIPADAIPKRNNIQGRLCTSKNFLTNFLKFSVKIFKVGIFYEF